MLYPKNDHNLEKEPLLPSLESELFGHTPEDEAELALNARRVQNLANNWGIPGGRSHIRLILSVFKDTKDELNFAQEIATLTGSMEDQEEVDYLTRRIAKLEALKNNCTGSTFVDCCSRDNHAGEVARFLGTSDQAYIDVCQYGNSELGSRKEHKHEGQRMLFITDEVVHAIANMNSESVGVFYFCAADVFQGDTARLWREMTRVLKPGGYIILDQSSSGLGEKDGIDANELEHYFEEFELTIIKKPEMDNKLSEKIRLQVKDLLTDN